MKEFIEACRLLSVFDHAFSGPLFTWSNKHKEDFLARKLDRALINGSWLIRFPHSTVEFLAPEVSDHSPVFISLQQKFIAPPKPFKFFNDWVKHPKFLELVQQSWCSQVFGNPMRRLHTKLKRLKADLKIFNQTHFGGISLKVTEKRKELAGIQVLLMNNVNSSELIELEKSVNLELHDLLLAEEWFYKQKARVNWINEGDQNTKFFQKTVAANQSRSTIKSLTTAAGVKLTTFTQISEEAVSFFQKLIGTVDTQVIGCPRHILE